MSIKNILALALVAPLFIACGKKEAKEPAEPAKAEETTKAAEEIGRASCRERVWIPV